MLAIPPKRFDRALITYLTEPEIDALLAAPDQRTWTGRRDHALLLLAVQTGLRVSELTGLTCGDVHLGTGAHVALPRQRPQRPHHPADQRHRHRAARLARRTRRPTRRPAVPDPHAAARSAATRVEHRIAHHAATAAAACPSLAQQDDHRRTCCATPPRCDCCTPASTPPSSRSGSATSSVETTQIYLHADLDTQGDKRSPAPHRPTPSPAATSRPTSSSRSSKRSDYADLPSAKSLPRNGCRHQVGITRRSA